MSSSPKCQYETKGCSHRDHLRAYCYSCSAIICEDCFKVHAKLKHDVRTVGSIAAQDKTRFEEGKAQYQRELEAYRGKVLQFQIEVAKTTERRREEISTKLTAIMNDIQHHFANTGNELAAATAKLLATITELATQDDLQRECDRLEMVVSKGECEEAKRLLQRDADWILKAREQNVAALADGIETTRKKQESFMQDSKIVEQMLDFWQSHSPATLTRLHKQLLTELQELESMRGDLIRQLRERKAAQIEFLAEMEVLQQEVAELKDRREIRAKQVERLEEKLAATEEKLLICEEKLQPLLVHITDKSREHEALANAVMAKQELLTKVERELAQYLTTSSDQPTDTQGGANVTIGDAKQALQVLEVHQELQQLQSKYVHCFDQKAGTIEIFDLESRKNTHILIGSIPLYPYHDSVQLRSCICVSGGFNSSTLQYLRTTVLLRLDDRERVEPLVRAEMIVPKSQHKLVALTSSVVYSLGGKNSEEKHLNVCECFDIANNKWTRGPNLTEHKFSVSACAFNCTALFVFGGFNGKPLRTIEEFRPAVEDKWRVFRVDFVPEWSARHETASVQVSEDEVLVFGGIDRSGACTEQVFALNVKAQTLSKCPQSLGKRDWFTTRNPVRYQDGIFIFGYLNKGLHVCSLPKRIWTYGPKPS